MKPKPLRALFVAIVLLAAASPGCRSKGSGPVSVVRLGYFANLAHAQALQAVASGELAAALAPIKLETRIFNAGPALVEALFADEIDVGYLGPGPALNAHARSKGEGIRVVAGAAANGVVIVARGDSDIHTLTDIKGKRIATPELGNTQDISARHYVTYVLKQEDADNILPIPNAELAGLFDRKALDAAWVPEPWGQLLVEQMGARVVAEEKDVWPLKKFGLAVVVTSPEFLSRHADVLERVLKVHHTWTQRLAANPDAYVAPVADSIYSLTGKRLRTSVVKVALARIEYTDDPQMETLRTYAKQARGLGLLPAGATAEGLVDLSVMQRAGGP